MNLRTYFFDVTPNQECNIYIPALAFTSFSFAIARVQNLKSEYPGWQYP